MTVFIKTSNLGWDKTDQTKSWGWSQIFFWTLVSFTPQNPDQFSWNSRYSFLSFCLVRKPCSPAMRSFKWQLHSEPSLMRTLVFTAKFLHVKVRTAAVILCSIVEYKKPKIVKGGSTRVNPNESLLSIHDISWTASSFVGSSRLALRCLFKGGLHSFVFRASTEKDLGCSKIVNGPLKRSVRGYGPLSSLLRFLDYVLVRTPGMLRTCHRSASFQWIFLGHTSFILLSCPHHD